MEPSPDDRHEASSTELGKYGLGKSELGKNSAALDEQ